MVFDTASTQCLTAPSKLFSEEIQDGGHGERGGKGQPFVPGHAGEQPDDDQAGHPGEDGDGRATLGGRAETPGGQGAAEVKREG